jgi:hypothetical protein
MTEKNIKDFRFGILSVHTEAFYWGNIRRIQTNFIAADLRLWITIRAGRLNEIKDLALGLLLSLGPPNLLGACR